MNNNNLLNKSQKSAIQYINKYVLQYKKEAQNDINQIINFTNNDLNEYNSAIENIKNYAKVGIHFHPDRPDQTFKTTIENLFDQGIYKNQFETFTSSGGLSAYKGGDRNKWEKILFGGSYNKFFIKDSERPKYGAIDLFHNPDGPSPRFGSCYFLLKPEVSKRCTFTYMDSHLNPKEKGTLEEFDLIMSGLLRDTFHYNNTLGENDISVKNLLIHLNNELIKPMEDLSNKNAKRHLNHYIEAQVHGNISLKEDVKIMVADPSFKETGIGDKIVQTCNKYSIKLLWHMGFSLKVNEVPDDFRGNEMPQLAKFITNEPSIDTHHLGLAVFDLYSNPKKWEKWGSQKDIIQKIKLLWHILVKYGQKYKAK